MTRRFAASPRFRLGGDDRPVLSSSVTLVIVVWFRLKGYVSMRVEGLPGLNNVAPFLVERRARPMTELLREIAPDAREVLLIAETFDLDVPLDWRERVRCRGRSVHCRSVRRQWRRAAWDAGRGAASHTGLSRDGCHAAHDLAADAGQARARHCATRRRSTAQSVAQRRGHDAPERVDGEQAARVRRQAQCSSRSIPLPLQTLSSKSSGSRVGAAAARNLSRELSCTIGPKLMLMDHLSDAGARRSCTVAWRVSLRRGYVANQRKVRAIASALRWSR